MNAVNPARKTTRSAMILAGPIGFVLLVLVLGTGNRVYASGIAGEFITDVWTADDGLPDSCVTALAQSPDGYLWVGTYNGLARFDGVRFAVFDPSNTPAIANSRILRLYADDERRLWINSFDGSMTSFRDGTFTQEWKGNGEFDPNATLLLASSNQVTFLHNRSSLRSKPRSAPPGNGWEKLVATNLVAGGQCVEDGNGMVWFCNPDKHLGQLIGTNVVLLPASCGLGGSRVNCMVTDSHGRLWVGTDAGIALWNGTRFKNATPTNSEAPADVEFLATAEDGGMWAVVNGGVRKAIDRRWILDVESLTNEFAGGLARITAQDDHRGGVWLYGYGRGLWHIAATGKLQMFGSESGFPKKHFRCFFEDREGNLWLGLDSGLVRISERRFQTIDLGGQIMTKPARSVCEDSQGTVWIGTLGDGLECWQGGTLTNLPVPGGMGRENPFCVCPDAAGRLWVSAGAEDLFVREHDEFKQVSPTIHGVKCILADKSGWIWVGTKSGLFFADKKMPCNFKLYEGTGQNNVRALSEDGRGNLWAGGEDGILFCIGTNATTAFHPADGPSLQPIWSLLAEADGTVWIGTFKGGLLRFRDGKFTRFGIQDGLPDNIICQILADGAGNLWIGSHQGIFRVAKAALDDFARGEIKSVPVTSFGRSDGLPSLECSGGYQPAAWRAQDGRLWFTTLKGAVSVQPDELQLNLMPPPVVIEGMLIDGNSLDATAKATEKSLPAGMVYDREKKSLEVPPGKHQFEFRYTGLSLISSERVKFRYQLEGANNSWVEAGTRRSVLYDLLPSGTYRFHVIACNNDRVWNETGDFLTLKIRPYFYEILWFRILAGLVAGSLLAAVVWFFVTERLRRNLEQLTRQQAVERERTRIAQDIHDDLGANLTLIARLGHLARSEKTVERIEKMESTARQAIKSLDEIVWAVNPRNDNLAHLIDYTGQFATDYLYAAGVRCRLDVPEQLPPREVPSNVRHNVFLVIKEALQNIVKHAHASEVWLRISATEQRLRIMIEDNGGGFAREPEDALADGLRNMRQRMKELGGECRIQSRVGTGTEITIEIPWTTN